MEVLVYDTSAKTLTVEDFFIPDSDKQEYGICSPICDASGTIYFIVASGSIDSHSCQIVTTHMTVETIPVRI